MKKILILFIFLLCLMSVTTEARANMAAPSKPDFNGSITFDPDTNINVLSEELNIKVEGATAKIEAIYQMENNNAEDLLIPSMFISPNIEDEKTTVLINDKAVDITIAKYYLGYESEVALDDWQYVILNPEEDEEMAYRKVEVISFSIPFKGKEKLSVKVSYNYQLGGYPDYDYDVKYGTIEYYLRPAAMWNGFKNLTINLYLDEDMPIIKESNLDFKKIEDRYYQYTSAELPNEDLKITIDQTAWQKFITHFNSPYLLMEILIFSPLIIIGLSVILVVTIVIVLNHRKSAKRNQV